MINCSDYMITSVFTDTSDFKYPLKDGAVWNYKRTVSVSDIRPDSIMHYFTDYPAVITGTVTVLYDTLIGTVTAKCFLDEFVSFGTSRSNKFYYANNDTALLLIFSRSHPASGLFPLNVINNFIQTEDFYRHKIIDNIGYSIFYDTIPCYLKYPVVTGLEWYYSNPFGVTTRKYLGFEIVSVPAASISCMKERTIYSTVPEDPIYNYYSKFGLMKRTWFLNDEVYSTIWNPTGIGIIDINDVSEILSFNIPSN